ncbi:MAG: biliverdin-producing heme oxygenase [Tatlockia sp.]|nr:biliverdin-producing heme oxygenase [Tatlockia sp.]
MDLRKRLQEETKCLHDQIEQTFLLKKILLKEITLSDYQLLIQQFYGFITPCEALIDSLSCKSVIKNRKKKPWLEQDLHALKISNNTNLYPSVCIDLPVLSEYEQVLGYLYVIEGATLGGQLITKMIKSQLEITADQGGRFFHGYGDKTKIMWSKFCMNLCSITQAEQKNKIIYSASDTFKRLHEWMDNRTLSKEVS